MATETNTETTEVARPRRADAERNRGRLVEAAAEAFRENGFEVGVAEIARRAGVGSATLFRNFPSKDDLIIAVIEARLTEAIEIVERAHAIDDPAESFERLMFDIAEMQARDVGFFETMHSRVIDVPALVEHKQRLVELAAAVLERAQRAGVVRSDIVAEDLRYLLASAVAQNCVDDPARGLYRRYLRIMLDGLRPGGASALTDTPPPAADARLR